jgi:hypothetical protein
MFGGFVPGTTAAEITAFQNSLFFQQAHRPVNGGDRNAGIKTECAAVKLFNIGVIVGFGKHARDYPTLAGHFQTMFNTQLLDT